MSKDVRGPIFIIGCARSGTTWLGEIFAQSHGFRTTIEHEVLFPLVDEAVLHWDRRAEVMEGLIDQYRARIAMAEKCIYVDKSHQNIWLVEDLNQAFPSALYVAIERAPYAVIASMMRHPGVRRHFVYWRNYPLPNPHLGIRESDVAYYDTLPLSVKCALRWRSHHHRLIELRRALDHRLHFIQYEQLVEYNQSELARLSDFVGGALRPVTSQRAGLENWRGLLSQRQRSHIDLALGTNTN
jgi:hypothetical protein